MFNGQGVIQMTKRALVVDNDFFFVEFLAELLQARGYEIVKAYDGKEGMEKLDGEPFAIMFADIVMPKIDGCKLIKYAREKFSQRQFPIVAVSGTVIEQLEELDRIGADYYIAKGPLENMETMINEFMDKLDAQLFPGEGDHSIISMKNIFPRRASVELIESLHFERAIIESIGLGILVVDKDGSILSTNVAALAILNISEMDVLNRKIPTLFLPEGRTQLIKTLKSISRNPELGKITLSVSTNSRRIRLIVSLLYVEEKKAGWIIAMEEMEKWEEQA
jgi:PAS domain S-box-containing protein